MLPTTPRGARTSEFWLIVATGVAAILHAIASSLGIKFTASADQLLMLAGVCSVVYAALRTWLKVHIPTVGDILPNEPSMPSFSTDALPTPTTHPPLGLSFSAAGVTTGVTNLAEAPPVTVTATPAAPGESATQTVPTIGSPV